MESPSFDLKQSIYHYIGLVQNQGSLTSSDKEELICHLYDSTEALQQHGLSEEESFIIASKRIGKVEVLNEEYSKVNTSLKSSKIWAYMVIGLNVFYSFPALIFTLVTVLYYVIHKQYGSSSIGVSLVTAIHLVLIISLWSIVKYKRKISSCLEQQVKKKPVKFISLTFVPLLISVLFTARLYRLMPGMSFNYPIYRFDSSITEFTFYLVMMSVIGVFLTLVFSINKVENFSLKTLFNRPSIAFLVMFGFAVELLAASTRAIQMDSIAVQALLFGCVYVAGSFLISYYNEASFVNRYLIIGTALGFVLEVCVGISADLGRGNTYFTAYFTAGMIAGVTFGRLLGVRFSNKHLVRKFI